MNTKVRFLLLFLYTLSSHSEEVIPSFQVTQGPANIVFYEYRGDKENCEKKTDLLRSELTNSNTLIMEDKPCEKIETGDGISRVTSKLVVLENYPKSEMIIPLTAHYRFLSNDDVHFRVMEDITDETLKKYNEMDHTVEKQKWGMSIVKQKLSFLLSLGKENIEEESYGLSEVIIEKKKACLVVQKQFIDFLKMRNMKIKYQSEDCSFGASLATGTWFYSTVTVQGYQ